MRYATAIVLAAMGIGEAVAGPTHAHLHKLANKKRGVDWAALDWDNMGIDWASAYAAGQAAKTATAAAAAATAAAPAAAVTASTAAAAVEDTVSTSTASSALSLFEGVVGHSNSLTAFGAATAPSGSPGDDYIGNVGNPYASNVIKVSSTSGYDFTATFVNSQSVAITVNCWLKVGSDHQPLSGSALAPHDTALTFALAAGASQVVAFQDNTQVGCAQAVAATTASGAFATTWFEGNFVSTGSGYDVSAIQNPAGSNYDLSITSKEAPGCTSDRTQNYWLTATDPVGTSDGSCYIAQSTATLKVVLGGTV